jgi:hypothetical protein
MNFVILLSKYFAIYENFKFHMYIKGIWIEFSIMKVQNLNSIFSIIISWFPLYYFYLNHYKH